MNKLSSFLINKSSLKEVTYKTEIKTLDVIASGPTPPNPAELLDSPKMKELLIKLNTIQNSLQLDLEISLVVVVQ